MFGIHDVALFMASCVLLTLAPGPDTMLVIARSATQGWRGGLVATYGIGVGIFVHISAAALGLSALLATSSHAFTVIKIVGALYLIYVGFGMLRSRGDPSGARAVASTALSYRRIFVQGFLTNVLNPKVALFFLAFVPQFIDPQAPHKALAFLLLGSLFVAIGMTWCHVLAFSTAFASQRIRVSQRVAAWLNRAIGGVFVGLGVKLALAQR